MQASVPEGIAAESVSQWLAGHVPALTPPVSFRLIAGGHSNLTYCCTDAEDRHYVLRRPPLGHVLDSAHDMGREYRIITALADSAVPVATIYGLCNDEAINGAPFFVMSFVAGNVLHDCDIAAALPASDRDKLTEHVIDVLAALHSIDPADVGLGDLGRHDGYIARQLKRWTRQWQATMTHAVPAMEETLRLLSAKMPAQIGTAIVHGDYRLGNFMIAAGRIQAVLDWELCTLGDPLADVGYLLNSWVSPEQTMAGVDERAPTVAGGFPSRDVLIARYAEISGRDMSHIHYYRAFSYWRIASIRQGVYKRYLEGAMGQNTDVDLESFKHSVEQCAEAALALISQQV